MAELVDLDTLAEATAGDRQNKSEGEKPPGTGRTVFRFLYRNYKGEFAARRVLPVRIWCGRSRWHCDEFSTEWFLRAFDLDRGEIRDFQMTEIRKL